MKTITLKLVLRSWWRNKTFSIISIISLAIGIACTNLLAAFVIYEYTIEANNPEREQIVYMAQDSPMQSGEIVSYVVGSIPIQLKEKYAEIEDYLRFNMVPCTSVKIDDKLYGPLDIVTVDTTFGRFFRYKVLAGSLQNALSSPEKVAISESCSHKLFGKTNPIGKIIIVNRSDDGIEMATEETKTADAYQIAAILQEYSQSYLKFDMLKINPTDFYGGPTLLKVSKAFDCRTFPQKLKQDGIPTLQGDMGSYYFYTLQDSYFQKYPQEAIPYINRGQRTLLSVGLVSALLILLIACFNYINLSFSRVLQQVRMIHIQKLMGASKGEVARQLFTDTLLTVLAAFLLSLLIAHDLMPVFNRIMSGRLSMGFFLNKQVLPVICGLILLLSAIPAFYMSRKLSLLTDSGYRLFFNGKKKQRVTAILSIVQFAISIGLVMATLTVHSQLKLLQKNGAPFRNLIEIGSWSENSRYIYPLSNELKKCPQIPEMTLAGGSILSAGLRQIIIKNPDGSEGYYPCIQQLGEENLLTTLRMKVLQGMEPHEALNKYEQPVYINRQYAKIMIPPGENPIGQPIEKYDDYFKPRGTGETGPASVICGITNDLFINSIETQAYPTIFYLNNSKREKSQFLYIRINEKQKETALTAIQAAYKKVNPGHYFSYQDVYQEFMSRNQKTTDMAGLLLMYAAISLFLTCFGLFGMALYATRQRTKEIGIRKVNGAGTWSILLLLTRQFIGWICIAFIIAAPFTWYALQHWLENFVVRTEVSFIHLVLAGAIVTVITLLTVSWHSYRAATSNPVKSLRSE